MPTLLVSGAGLGDAVPDGSGSTEFGVTVAGNKWPSLAPLGVPPSGVGYPVVSPPVPGKNVQFDFVVEQNQTADNVRLDFDTTRPVLENGWSATFFGTTVVANKSLGVFEQGWNSELLGTPIVSDNLPGRIVNFDFTVVYMQTAQNVGLYFDGKPVATGVGLKDQSAFGFHKLTQPLQALPLGIPPIAPWIGVAFVGGGGAINFNFVDAYAPSSGQMVRLDFSPQRPVLETGFSATLFGTTVVQNKSFGAFERGWDSAQLGASVISFKGKAQSLNFEFSDSYTPITGINVAFAWGESRTIHVDAGIPSLEFGLTTEVSAGIVDYVRPYGWFDAEVGNQMISNFHRTLTFFGIHSFEFGSTLIANRHRTLQTVGYPDSIVSEPRVHSTLQRIVVYPGFDAFGFGIPKVKSSIGPNQILWPDGFDAILWGRSAELPLVAFEFRSISFEMTPATEQTQYGTHYVGYRIRRVYPDGEPYVQWGLPRLGYSPKCFPVGVDMSIFGMAAMSYGNVLAPLGFDVLGTSLHWVQFAKRYLKTVEEKEQATYGVPYIWNLRQYAVEDNSIYFVNAPPFGFDTRIYNRNTHIYPEGVVPPKVERTHRLHNTGVAVAPQGLDSQSFGGTTVWFRVRHVNPTGYAAGMIGEYHYVWNYATRLYTEGFDAQEFPIKHMAWFNAQHVTAHGFDRQRFGFHFISDSPRTLDQQLTTDTLTFGETWVSHSPRYLVEGAWPDQIFIPTPLVQIHFTIMRPHPWDSRIFGTATVRNVTPEIFPPSFNLYGIGEPWVSRSPRFLTPQGFSVFASPQQTVTYANRPIFLRGLDSFTMPRHRIWTEVAGELDARYIRPEGIEGLDDSDWPYPSLGINGIYPDGWDSAKFGDTRSDAQGCHTRWYDPDSRFQFGVPSLNATQIIDLDTADPENEKPLGEGIDGTQWTKQRISPHTIWCRHDTPQQAIENHRESKPWCDMDLGPECNWPPRPYFGDANVFTPHTEYLLHYHPNTNPPDTTVGGWVGDELEIQNQHRRLYVIGGIFQFKPGMQHSVNGPRKIWTTKWDVTEIGVPTISTPPVSNQRIGPRGWDSFICSGHTADNFDRPIYPEGYTNTEWGDNKPMVYHYPRGPKNVSGTDMLTFGPDTWISPYVRGVEAEGWESFEEGYTLEDFAGRLRIKQGPPYTSMSVGDSFRSGFPKVSYGQGAVQRIGPYMIPPPQYCHPHSVEEVV